jgi:gluconolactonase
VHTRIRAWLRMLPATTAIGACLLLAIASGARAGSLAAIDGAARYPEAPVWHDGQLYYVEYAANDIRRWDGKDTTLFWHRDGCGPSGLFAVGGHWLVACYDDNSIVELDASAAVVGTSRVDDHGRPFSGPNDFTTDGRGGAYFSASGVYDTKAPISGAILHMSAGRKSITEVANTVHYPNGLTLSADGRQLLVAEMLAGRILAFPVAADGTLGPRSVWARLRDLAPPTSGEDAYNGPDGLKVGPDGHYYIAQNGSGRVLVVGADRKLVRMIEVPTPYVTNLAFGAAGSGAVFITGVFDEWKAPFPGAVYRWQP